MRLRLGSGENADALLKVAKGPEITKARNYENTKRDVGRSVKSVPLFVLSLFRDFVMDSVQKSGDNPRKGIPVDRVN